MAMVGATMAGLEAVTSTRMKGRTGAGARRRRLHEGEEAIVYKHGRRHHGRSGEAGGGLLGQPTPVSPIRKLSPHWSGSPTDSLRRHRRRMRKILTCTQIHKNNKSKSLNDYA
jgi:hypothetical protein